MPAGGDGIREDCRTASKLSTVEAAMIYELVNRRKLMPIDFLLFVENWLSNRLLT